MKSKLFIWLAALAATFGLIAGVVAIAQSSPGGTWAVYVQGNEQANVFMVQADAADAYMGKLVGNGSSSACNRYYWNSGFTGPYTAAQWVKGVLVQGCAGSYDYAATSIAVQLTCTATSADDRCHALFSPANEKNAGVTCDSCPGDSSGLIKPQGTQIVGNPINLGTGNKFQIEPDFTVPSSPLLNFTRYYNSQYAFARGKAMGFRWRHSFDYFLEIRPGQGVALLRPDGSVRTFGGSEDIGADSQGFIDYILDAQGGVTGYKFDNLDGRVETYAKGGTISRIDFREGGFLVFEYDPTSGYLSRVLDHFGRALVFATDTKGRVVQVTSPTMSVYSYAYDIKNRLVTRTAPSGGVRTYGYDSRPRIEQIK